jgi:uncharacterized protein (DUF4213/DUF364 family)
MPSADCHIERSRQAFAELARERGLSAAAATVVARPLSSEEAIGRPGRRDYPLLKGKERLVEAAIGEARGNAFTDAPREFTGSVDELLALPLDDSRNRGLYVAALNAAFQYAGLVRGTVHCRDDAPERCARQIVTLLEVRFRWHRVGLIGFNPAIAQELARRLGAERLRVTDLNPENVGTERFGVPIWDGETRFAELIEWADGLLVTGSTFVNGTFDALHAAIERAGKPMVLYGVTAAAMAHLFGFERLCPCARG